MRFSESFNSRGGAPSWVWQLMLYVVACVTVLIAFQAFRQPQNRRPPVSQQDELTSAEPFQPNASNDLGPDEFRSPPPDLGTSTPPSRPAEKPNRREPHLKVDLSTIRDNTISVRFDESAAFFDLLHQARKAPDEIDAHVRHDVQYANLMADPAAYRGQAIALTGELWRLTPFQAATNSHGLQTLYEAWVVTHDSAPHAYRVVTSQIGPDLEPGMNVHAPVFVTGYFFKREGYATKNGVEVTPTVISAGLDWDDTVPQPTAMAAFPPWMRGLVIAGGLILTATLVSLALSERRSVRQHPRYEPLRAETLTALAALPPYSIGNVLQELEDKERVRQFEGVRAPHIKPTGSLWTKTPRPAANREAEAIDLPTPTPPTRQFRHRPDSGINGQ